MKTLRRILVFARPYRGSAVVNIIANVLYSLFNLASIGMIIPFLRLLFGQTKVIHQNPGVHFTLSGMLDYFNYFFGAFVEKDKTYALTVLCIVVAVLFLLKNLAGYIAAYAIAKLRHGIIKDLRSKLFTKILDLPLSFFTNERKGNIINRITNDVQEIEWSVLQFLEALFKNPLNIFLFAFTMIKISTNLTLFVLLVLPVAGIIIGYLGKNLRKASHLNKSLLGRLLTTIDETIMGQRVVKGFNASHYLYNQFSVINNSFFKSSVSIQRRRDLSSPISEVLGIFAVVIVLWFGGKLVLKGEGGISSENFIAFIILFSQIINPAKAMSEAWYSIQKGIASFERIEEVLNAPLVVLEKENAIDIKSFNDKIVYENVSFSYNDHKKVLSNIKLIVNKGETIALVGQSGAGKSTLVDLLPRFYDVITGSITIDGIDTREMKISSLRNLIGIVTQDPILFNDSVFNNIVFGMENVSEEQVMEAAKIANAHTFITQLENGYETEIGDRGSRLSGGQRQRITIARAVLRNTPILILDEATSSLDTESERLVQDALTRLMQNRTSIVIAHRLSTVQNADMIVVLQDGRIVETGKHSLLMKQDGIYRRLNEMQGLLA